MNTMILINAVSVKAILISAVILLAVGAVLGILLAVASKYLQVKQDERITKVVSLLPGYNCGACGKAGCASFGESLVTGESKAISGCKVIKPEKKQEIKDYLDNAEGPDGSKVSVTL